MELITTEIFDHNIVIQALQTKFGDKFTYRGDFSKWGVFCFIDNEKVDLVQYPHKQIKEAYLVDKVRIYDDEDLIAMKIQVISGRGKKKDFRDIAELLEHYSLEKMISFHKRKYPNQMLGISIPYALTYFTDADESEEPQTQKN